MVSVEVEAGGISGAKVTDRGDEGQARPKGGVKHPRRKLGTNRPQIEVNANHSRNVFWCFDLMLMYRTTADSRAGVSDDISECT